MDTIAVPARSYDAAIDNIESTQGEDLLSAKSSVNGSRPKETRLMSPKLLVFWYCTVSIILVLAGITFSVFGLAILPVNRSVLLSWESAIYGAIMMGWGTTLFLIGRIAFRRNDRELMLAMLYGLVFWLVMEGLFSAYLGVFFNVG